MKQTYDAVETEIGESEHILGFTLVEPDRTRAKWIVLLGTVLAVGIVCILLFAPNHKGDEETSSGRLKHDLTSQKWKELFKDAPLTSLYLDSLLAKPNLLEEITKRIRSLSVYPGIDELSDHDVWRELTLPASMAVWRDSDNAILRGGRPPTHDCNSQCAGWVKIRDYHVIYDSPDNFVHEIAFAAKTKGMYFYHGQYGFKQEHFGKYTDEFIDGLSEYFTQEWNMPASVAELKEEHFLPFHLKEVEVKDINWSGPGGPRTKENLHPVCWHQDTDADPGGGPTQVTPEQAMRDSMYRVFDSGLNQEGAKIKRWCSGLAVSFDKLEKQYPYRSNTHLQGMGVGVMLIEVWGGPPDAPLTFLYTESPSELADEVSFTGAGLWIESVMTSEEVAQDDLMQYLPKEQVEYAQG